MLSRLLRYVTRRDVDAPRRRTPSIRRNAVWNWSAQTSNAVVFFFVSPFVIGTLGNEAYGVWAVLQTLNGYLNFAALGVRPAVVHYIARHGALNDVDGLNRYVNSALVVFGLGGMAVLLACGVIAPFLPEWFSVSEALRTDAVLALFIAGATLALELPLTSIGAVIPGMQRYDLSAKIALVVLGIRTAGVVFALSMGYGLVGLAIANSVAQLGSMGVRALIALRLQPGLRIAPRLADRAACGGLLQFGLLNVVYVVSMTMSYQTDALVIGTQIDLTAVAFFAVGSRLVFRLRGMLEEIGAVLAPAIGALDARNEHARIAQLVERMSRVLLILAAPCCVYLVHVGPAFLERWIGGADYRIQSGPVLVVLTLGGLASIAAVPLMQLHQGLNRMRPLAVFGMLEGLANLGLSIALVGPLGIYGVALGTAIPSTIVRGIVLPWWMCRMLRTPLPRTLAAVWTRPLLAGAITYLALRWGWPSPADAGWIRLVGVGLLVVAAYAVAYALVLGIERLVRGESRERSAST